MFRVFRETLYDRHFAVGVHDVRREGGGERGLPNVPPTETRRVELRRQERRESHASSNVTKTRAPRTNDDGVDTSPDRIAVDARLEHGVRVHGELGPDRL